MIKNKKLYRRLYNKFHTTTAYRHYKRAYLKLANKMKQNIDIDESLFTKSIINEYKKKWSVFDKNPSTIFFKLYSSLRGEVDLNYVPDYLYRFPIELILLNKRYSLYHENKCLYDHRLEKYKELFPKTFVKKINGVYYDGELNFISNIRDYIQNLDCEQLVLKDSIDTGAGKDVQLFKRNSDSEMFINDKNENILSWMQNIPDLVVQKREYQSKYMNSINPSSINTLRIVTYRSVANNEVYIMQSLIKRGPIGSFVDNLNSGGNFIEIKKDRLLANYGLTKEGLKVPFDKGREKFPYMDKVHELAKEIAEGDLFHRQLFFDIFIDENDSVRVMEINYSAHPTIQAVCGSAFGEFTDEVIEYCQSNVGHLVRVIPFKV